MVVWSRPSYVTAGVVHLCSPTSPESRNYRLLSGRMECLILVDSAMAERFRLVERLVGEENITTHEWSTMLTPADLLRFVSDPRCTSPLMRNPGPSPHAPSFRPRGP